MKSRILVACVGVPLILVVLFVLPAPFTPALIGVLSAVATYEIMHAIGMNHPRVGLYTAALALAIPFWVYFETPHVWAVTVLLAYLASLFGFGSLIGTIYPLFGYASAVFLAFTLAHAARLFGRKNA